MTQNAWNSENNNTDGKLLIGNTSSNKPLVGDLVNTDGVIGISYNNPDIESILTSSSLQTAFYAYNATLRSNVTGDGTLYTIPFDAEDFDTGSDFNTANGRFTAPQTGVYHLTTSVNLSGIGSEDDFYLAIVIYDSGFSTVQQNLELVRGSPSSIKDSGNELTFAGSVCVEMTVGEIAVVQVLASGGSLVVDIPSGTLTTQNSYFCGALIA